MTVLTYYLLIQLILNLTFQKRGGFALCGVFAVSLIKGVSKEQARIATQKLKLLGTLMFPSRGKDACGIFVNGNIIKGDKIGSKDTTEFDDFLMQEEFTWPQLDITKTNIMLGHVRAASYGVAKIDANTHPFHIKGETEKDDIILIHNGTLSNHWTLCKQYEIDHVDLHINSDSLALGHLLVRGGTKVLEEYQGDAALIWTKPSQPNTLWVYHGASLKSKWDKTLTEERPLYYMHTEEGCYFASEARYLNAIRESDKEKPEWLKMNAVLKITNGKFSKDFVTINREEANLNKVYSSDYYQQGEIGYPSQQRTSERSSNIGRNVIEESRKRIASKATGLEVPKTNICWEEPAPKMTLAQSGKIYTFFHKGRYYLSTGDFIHGQQWIADRGIVHSEQTDNSTCYWFWRGVMLKDEPSYRSLSREAALPNSWLLSPESNYACYMSRYSKDPVCNLLTECIDEDDYFRFSWYKDDARALVANITPLFSGKTYIIKNGFLQRIADSDSFQKEDNCFDIIFKDLSEMMNTLEDNEVAAIEAFMFDEMKAEMIISPDIKQVQSEVWCLIKNELPKQKTIREILNDNDNALEGYLKVLTKPKEESETLTDDEIMFEAYGYCEIASSEAKLPPWEFVKDNFNTKAAAKSRFACVTAESDMKEEEELNDDEALYDAYQKFNNPSSGKLAQEAIDEVLAQHESNQIEAHSEACDKVEELLNNIEETATITDEMELIKTPYAQQITQAMRRNIRVTKKDIEKLAADHHDDSNFKKVNQTNAE